MPNGKQVRDSLERLQCPQYSDSIWIAPFELLTGAAYALLAAERHGFSRRDQRKYAYHTHVRENIASLVGEYSFAQQASDRAAFDDWVSGFYFNSAVQRIVWAAERLLVAFAGIPCSCGQAPEVLEDGRPGFGEIWKAASRRLEHVANEHQQDLSYVHVLLRQMPPDRHFRRETPFNPDTVFSMLRHDLERKHGLGLHPHDEHHQPAGTELRLTWSTAGPGLQMQFVCAAFSLLCHAYNELLAWHSGAREEAIAVLGEQA